MRGIVVMACGQALILGLTANAGAQDAAQMGNRCATTPAIESVTSAPAWNGWGADPANTRFQPGAAAQLRAADLPRLKLKWALRVLSSSDGHTLWEFNTLRDFETVNRVEARGGSMGAPGPVVAGGLVFVPSGYVGVRNGAPGNVLLVFGVD